MEIYVKNLTKKFGMEKILKNINFKIREGEGILLYGKNGAGKTTLLKILNFLEKPTSGEIIYFSERSFSFGINSKRDIEFQKKMIFIPQKPVIFSTSLIENVKIGLRIRKEVKSNNEINRVLKMFELLDIKDKFAHFLSSGQKQKISLIRGLLLDTEMILLDEPTNNLDEKSKQVLKKILKVKKSRGVSYIISSPDLKEWEDFYFEKIYKIENGYIEDMNRKKDSNSVKSIATNVF